MSVKSGGQQIPEYHQIHGKTLSIKTGAFILAVVIISLVASTSSILQSNGDVDASICNPFPSTHVGTYDSAVSFDMPIVCGSPEDTTIGSTFEFEHNVYRITSLLPNTVTLVEAYQIHDLKGHITHESTDYTLTAIGEDSISFYTESTPFKVLLPETVKTIESNAFCGTHVEEINLDNLEEIQAYAFSGCKNLKSVVIPHTVTKIETGVFRDCISLEEIIILPGVKSIGKDSFAQCPSLKLICIPDSIETTDATSFQDVMLYDREGNRINDGLGGKSFEFRDGVLCETAAMVFHHGGVPYTTVVTGEVGSPYDLPLIEVGDYYLYTEWEPIPPRTIPDGTSYYSPTIRFEACTVTFDTSGGTPIDDVVVRPGVSIHKPIDPVKTGFSFNGWFIDESCSHPYDFSWPVTNDITLYAGWVPVLITVIFDTAGGSPIEPITSDFGSILTAPPDPTRDGYIFQGWSPSLPETMPDSDTTYVASWKIDAIIIEGGVEETLITKDVLDTLGGKGVTAQMTNGVSITIPNEICNDVEDDMLLRAAFTEGLSKAQKEVIGDNTALDIAISFGDSDVGLFNSNIVVTLSCNGFSFDDPEKISVSHIGIDGRMDVLPSAYDSENNTMTFEINHSSVYMVDISHAGHEVATGNSNILVYVVIALVLVAAIVSVLRVRH